MESTMKIGDDTHQKLKVLKAVRGDRSFDETINFLITRWEGNNGNIFSSVAEEDARISASCRYEEGEED